MVPVCAHGVSMCTWYQCVYMVLVCVHGTSVCTWCTWYQCVYMVLACVHGISMCEWYQCVYMVLACVHGTSVCVHYSITVEPLLRTLPIKDTIEITSLQRTLCKAPKIDILIVLIHISPLQSGQLLYSGQITGSQFVLYREVPLLLYHVHTWY